MKYWLICAVLSLTQSIYGQTILIFDLENGTLDSLVSFPIDTALTSSQTNHYEGSFSPSVEVLSNVYPSTNTFPQSEFSLKRKVELDYSINDFPIRSVARISGVIDGIKMGTCSGTMISGKHVLTAAHCHFDLGTNDLSMDNYLVCPTHNNGLDHPEFGCVEVRKIYVIKDWSLVGEDFALLELKESIGYETGWLGIGFEEDSTTQVDRMYYKFSYPAAHQPWVDSTIYNGDTLYYNYGRINYLTDIHLGVSGGNGIPGESGSAIIHVENNQTYTIYGALSLSANLSHTRITNWIYHALFSIIENDLSTNESFEGPVGYIYPNPVEKVIHIEGINSINVVRIQNTLGQEVPSWIQEGNQLFVGELISGIYFLSVETEGQIISFRFVKQ